MPNYGFLRTPQEKTREQHAEAARRRYWDRKAQGICTRCLSPAREGHVTCEFHGKALAAAVDNTFARRVDANTCRDCGLPPVEGKVRCEYHLMRRRRDHRARMERKAA